MADKEIAPVNDLQTNGTKKDFLDCLGVVIKWRQFIIVNVLVVAIIASVISFLLPKWYKATATLLPPKDQGLLNSLGSANSLLRGFGSSKLGGLGQNLGAYNYFAILRSRTAFEATVNRFNLFKVYNIGDSSMEKAIEALNDNVTFEIQPDDYITIEVYDKEPQRAADIANYFIDQLNAISIRLGTQEARSNREFIQDRLTFVRDSLRQAEENLRKYQERTGIIISPEQSNSNFSAIAELYGLRARKEIELGILERTTSKENIELQQLQLELDEINKKVAGIPAAGVESYRLYRAVAIQQKIVEYLIPLFEQAKIDEQKKVPVILVLDKAKPPERKAKPRRMYIIGGAAIAALLFSLLLVFVRERVATILSNDPAKRAKLQAIVDNTPLIRRTFGK
jgi:tyrosine-protein kinase Etk/Wzc